MVLSFLIFSNSFWQRILFVSSLFNKYRSKEVVEQSNLVENWTLKQDSLQVVTREADAFWELLAQAGCRMQEIEVNNRSLLNTIFEETQKGDN